MSEIEVQTVMRDLTATYDFEGALLAYHGKRSAWGGLSASQMIAADRGPEVIEWAQSLAGGRTMTSKEASQHE